MQPADPVALGAVPRRCCTLPTRAMTTAGPLSLSIVIPCYNEAATLARLLARVAAAEVPGTTREIIVVDDGSTDGSADIIREFARTAASGACRIVPLVHDTNRGKGAALKTALARTHGDIVIIQDADLEYDPSDYLVLLRPIQTGRSKVVYGSRFIGEHRAMYFWHSLGNQFLTLLCNALFDTTLTDMETCYKVFTIDIARHLRLREPGWGFDPEITARILKMGNRIYEVPISYAGREFNEGKKISWQDGFTVLVTLLRYRFLP
jgi:glycosyltransferase involved in cell wall biosynthesis